MVVNRSLSQTKNVRVTTANSPAADGEYKTLALVNLPATETFRSHTDNALQAGEVTVQDGRASLSLPPLSITAVLLWK